jgi:hypothetical protein
VITLAVVPTVIVVMSLLGCFEVGRRRPADPTGWLLILNALTPLLFAATGLQAAYSGERHFIPAYPYLACLAGVGFGTTFALLRTRLQVAKRRLPTVPLAAVVGLFLGLLFVPAMISAGQVFPYELSYYSEVVGGLPGATRLGLETTFWCETYLEALPFLNEHAEPGASIWAENPFVLRYYQRSGLLRLDLEATGGDTVSPLSADYALVQRRQTGFDYYTPDIGSVMASHEPVFSVDRQGELLLELFRIVGRSTS